MATILLWFVAMFALLSEFVSIDRTIDSLRLFGFAAVVGVFVTILLSRQLLRLAFTTERWGARASYILILACGITFILL
jgi:hypothetical protein